MYYSIHCSHKQGLISKGDDIADYSFNTNSPLDTETVKVDLEWIQDSTSKMSIGVSLFSLAPFLCLG